MFVAKHLSTSLVSSALGTEYCSQSERFMALFLTFSKHTVAENLPKVLNMTGFKSDREFEKRPSMMHTLAPSCGRMMELSLMLLETSVPPKVLCWLRSGDCRSCLSTLNSLF